VGDEIKVIIVETDKNHPFAVEELLMPILPIVKVKDALEGRQDKKVAEDKSNDEEGLESLGRPTNDYFKNQYSKNNKAIGIKSDGRDYSNVDFGENVGDASNPEDLKFKKYYDEFSKKTSGRWMGVLGLARYKKDFVYIISDEKNRIVLKYY